MDLIAEFEGEFRFLSNFYPSPVLLDGVIYPSVENAYQAAKSLDAAERERFLDRTPAQAKRLGKIIDCRQDWIFVRLEIMEMLLRQKFDDPVLKLMLLETGDAELVEGNWWGDMYWGKSRGVGENHLGRLLMQIRAEHRAAFAL